MFPAARVGWTQIAPLPSGMRDMFPQNGPNA